MNLVLRTSTSTIVLAAASLAASAVPAVAQQAGTTSSDSKPVTVATSANKAAPSSNAPDLHEIIVEGIRQSIESSIGEKRNSSQIMDSVTAQDIGQLANNNIAEALQRIPGVQVARSADGEGESVQIRGLSENNVELNGETVSGSTGTRGVNFQDLPPELFSGVQILKTSTARSIEGSLGGTIDLQTRAPLTGKKRMFLNITTKGKYQSLGKLYDQDVSGLFIKQWRNTGIGDVGILLNAGYKHIQTKSEVYGGGDYAAAPAIWTRRTGADAITNKANPFYNSSIWPTALPGANSDGSPNPDYIYYMPNNFGFFVRDRDEKRRSFNGTLQWKPSHNLDIRFDTMLTDDNESLTGSRYSVSFAAPFELPMASGPGNDFVQLTSNAVLNPLDVAQGATAVTGPIYFMQAGRLAGANTRIGAAPSQNDIKRTSQLYKLQLDWQAMPSLQVHMEGSISRGSAHTIVQGQLNTGADFNGDGQFNAKDWAGIVDYSLAGGLIPNLTMYQSPFQTTARYGDPVTSVQTTLTQMDPSNINYARQMYFQFQRNATDTLSNNKTARIDLTWDAPSGGLLRDVQFGYRYAQREFRQVSFQNSNQHNGPIAQQVSSSSNPIYQVNVQAIPVNTDAPITQKNATIGATSNFLSSCLDTAGVPGMLSQFGGNLPTTWGDTAGCPINDVGTAFNMIPVRAINPNTGVGYYEQVQAHYDVKQTTLAAYLMADFQAELFGSIDFYGNGGVRYVQTNTDSSGFVQAQGGGFDPVTLKGKYDDWLPSANLNFALTNNLILRLAYTRTLGRPSLAFVSPGIKINYNDSAGPDYAGTGTAGNPGLKPVHSDNFDGSLEWYYAKASYMSVAVFQKNIDSTIFLDPTPSPVQIGSNLFLVNTYQNFPGTRIRGIEFGMAHAFRYLPGILRHLGMTANYTIIDENSDLIDQEGSPISRKGLSKYSYNVAGYYDDGKFSVRLAYNWRSAFTRRESVDLGYGQAFALPEMEASRGQLDGAIRYKINRHATVTFNAINITNTGGYRYMKYYQLTNYIAEAGRAYNLVVSVNF